MCMLAEGFVWRAPALGFLCKLLLRRLQGIPAEANRQHSCDDTPLILPLVHHGYCLLFNVARMHACMHDWMYTDDVLLVEAGVNSSEPTPSPSNARIT
jgi:hypothetical protein